MVDTRLKQMVKELGDAINGSLSESEQIAAALHRIKEAGYDIFLVLEATIGFTSKDAKHPRTMVQDDEQSEPNFTVSAQDARFLKSLRIAIDDKAA